MKTIMRAIVLKKTHGGKPRNAKNLPKIQSRPNGWVVDSGEGFGLNRSELHTCLGLAEGVTSCVIGIEAVGSQDAAPGTDLCLDSKL